MTSDPFWIEEYPRIRMSALKRMGIFDHPGKKFGISSADRTFIIIYNAIDEVVNFVFDNNGPKLQKFEIDWVQLKYGRRPYFVSEISEQIFLDLYFKQGVLESAETHRLHRGSRRGDRGVRWRAKADRIADRLVGRDGYAQPRGRNRQKLADEFIGMAATNHVDHFATGAAFEAREQANKVARRAYRYDALTGPLSTAAAARAGHNPLATPATPWILGADIRWESRSLDRGHDMAKLKGRISFVEDYAVLDAGSLSKLEPPAVTSMPRRIVLGGTLKMIRAQSAWAVTLKWRPDKVEGALALTAVVDTPADGGAVVQIKADYGDRSTDQLIDLEIVEHGGRSRWYLICPVTKRRCDRLFFREGRFASAAAQRLVHRSQRVVPFS